VLAASCCRVAQAGPEWSEAEWNEEIQTDWLLQLARAAKTFGISKDQYAAYGCDGVRDGDTGFQTGHQENPWWQVCLDDKPQRISRIVVYNTEDNPELAKNLSILLSDDDGNPNSKWREVYRHNGQVFGGAKDGKPLVVQLEGQTARVVRVALSGKGSLQLAEVEVYGPDAPGRNLALNRKWADQSSVVMWFTAPPGWKPRVPLAYIKKELPKALERAERLYADLCGMAGVADLSAEAAALERLRAEVQASQALDLEAAKALYFKIRRVGRELALKNPLVTAQPILFMMRHRECGYMLYEYLGWYYSHGHDPISGARSLGRPTAKPGGGIFVLERPGRTPQVRPLLSDPVFQKGHFVTLSLSFDAKTVYFAWADPTGKEPYTLPGYAMAPAQPGVKYNTFHIWAMDVSGGRVRQLTDGPYDDFDPCPLPDGGIAFMSTRRGSRLRCGGGSPELAYTLHRMDADGKNIRTLSFHETNEWHPSVLNDGRIVFTRWDYVDRNAACFQSLWTCNPDGSNPAVLFGNYTTRPNGCYQAKAVPGSNKILFIGGGHHCNVGGTLLMLDPSRVALDPRSGEDRSEALECLTPEVCFPETEGWPKSYYYSPWPLSEKYFLVAYSHDPLFGGYTGVQRETETGLYYFDRFGNLELLFRQPGISAAYPIPLAPRTPPPVRSVNTEKDLGAEGEFLLSDVYSSLLPMPAGRRIVELRVFQLLPKSRTDRQSYPPIGHEFAFGPNARMLLGTVPVEEDGSAYFRAPAKKPLYFQAVDASGRAVQSMLSVVYLQPGERRSCIGCHEPTGAAPANRTAQAFLRPPSSIRPGPDGSLPFGYPRLVQPVLDRLCVRCHDGSIGPDKSKLVLTGEPLNNQPLAWSKSYVNLKPYLGLAMLTVSRPGQITADRSKLAAILTSQTHRKYVEVPDNELRILYLWLDANAPFYGTYEEEGLAAQKLGAAIPPPRLQ